jgi:hypothetical protein
MNRKLTATVAAVAAALGIAGAAAGTRPAGAAPPLVTIVRHGGLCLTDATTAGECRSVLRITETTISGDGLVPRPLTRAERRELTRAIRGLDAA